jgi:large subunit ribosomal protein L9
MEIILLEKVHNLGNLGDKVKVKAGYGRNFLIPQKKAVPANKANLVEFEKRRQQLEKQAEEKLAAAQARKTALEKLQVSITAKAGDEGKMYGSIGTRDLAQAISAAGTQVDKNEIRLPNGVIRHLGDYSIDLQLHTDVSATVSVSVVQE